MLTKLKKKQIRYFVFYFTQNVKRSTATINLSLSDISVHASVHNYAESILNSQGESYDTNYKGKLINIDTKNHLVYFSILDIISFRIEENFLLDIGNMIKYKVKPNSKINIFSDGGCSPPTFNGGIGASVYLDKSNLFNIRGNIGPLCTNNTAEYTSMIMPLIILSWVNKETQLDTNLKWVLYSDSQLLVKQLSEEYKIKQPHLKVLNFIVRHFVLLIAEQFNKEV